jgi:predicted nucleic acid-binding protein
MAFVLDASVTLSWALEDTEQPVALQAQMRIVGEPAYVPAIWWFEVRNVLLVNERRQRVTQQDTSMFLRSLSRMQILVDREPVDQNVLMLARTHRLTIYDAAYLELALREALPLATLDRALATAARASGVALVA